MPPESQSQARPSTQPLSPEYVRKVATLCRLELSDEQARRSGEHLSAILGYFHRLDAPDLSGVEPMATPLESPAPLRDDTVAPALGVETVMALAPAKRPPYIEVPEVLGGAGPGGAAGESGA